MENSIKTFSQPLVFIGQIVIFTVREFPQMGCAITMDDSLSLEELREEIDDLRQLVKTLLTIIMEEADGVQTGSAPSIPDQPKRGYCM